MNKRIETICNNQINLMNIILVSSFEKFPKYEHIETSDIIKMRDIICWIKDNKIDEAKPIFYTLPVSAQLLFPPRIERLLSE